MAVTKPKGKTATAASVKKNSTLTKQSSVSKSARTEKSAISSSGSNASTRKSDRAKKLSNPFRHRSSLAYRVFSMAMVGVTFTTLRKFVTSNGGDPGHYLRLLRTEKYNAQTWKTVEDKSCIQVVHVSLRTSKAQTGDGRVHGRGKTTVETPGEIQPARETESSVDCSVQVETGEREVGGK